MSRFSFFRRGQQKSAKDKGALQPDSFASGAAERNNPNAKKDQVDPMLPQKKRARRRLVGALVLALTAIVVLPMIFDSEPKPVRQDLLIDIPSKDKPVSSSPKEKTEKPAITPAAVAEANNSAEAPPALEPAPESAPQPQAKPPAEAAKPQEATPKKDSGKPPKTAGQEKSADPIERIIASKSDADAKADAEKTQDKFTIQVAALASQQKVSELQDKLTKAGIKSRTQKVAVEGGERIRVRIGPLSSKKEVDSMCAKLSKMNLQCTVINN